MKDVPGLDSKYVVGQGTACIWSCTTQHESYHQDWRSWASLFFGYVACIRKTCFRPVWQKMHTSFAYAEIQAKWIELTTQGKSPHYKRHFDTKFGQVWPHDSVCSRILVHLLVHFLCTYAYICQTILQMWVTENRNTRSPDSLFPRTHWSCLVSFLGLSLTHPHFLCCYSVCNTFSAPEKFKFAVCYCMMGTNLWAM